MDHYSILQVARDAEPEVVEKAYRALCLKYHPDVVPEAQRLRANRKMQRINVAYDVLGDPKKRRVYDLTLPPLSTQGAWDVFLSKGLVGMLLDKLYSG
ncbi:MAG: J domain-containing protein [Coriobacteriia bacterium]|nr:J domain-containing protein [Coriobacteriia bacterium]